jgi:glycopeptide antibiotics resistance protein
MNRHRKTVICIIFVLYCVVMKQLLFFRSPSPRTVPYWQTIRENINLIPLTTIREPFIFIRHSTNRIMVHYAYVNLFGNILIFIPCGIFLPLFGNKTKKLSRTILISFITFLVVETVQLFSLTGRADIDDVLLNLLGCLFGYGLWRVGNALHKRKTEQKNETESLSP